MSGRIARRRIARRRIARRRAVAVLIAAALGAAAWAGVSYWPRGPGSATPTTTGSTSTTDAPGTTATTATTSTTTTTTTTTPASAHTPRGIGAFSVGHTSLVVTAPLAEDQPRPLQTQLWYPVRKGSTGSAPDHAAGPFPLLVFSQGFWTTVTDYGTLLDYWASAGYVVAAPEYPTTAPDPSIAGTTPKVFAYESAGLQDHPTDLRHVIQALVTKAGHPGWALSGLVDANAIGIVGQSDGGDVSLAVGYNSAYQDPAVKAVAVLSGSEYAGYDKGGYFTGPHPPLLAVQSPSDEVNPEACSVEFYNAAPQPKWYLQLEGLTGQTRTNGHLGPYSSLLSYEEVIGNVTTYFFDAELTGQHGALTTMGRAGTATALATLSNATAAPTAPGTCRTA